MALHPAQKRINKKKSAETTTATTTTPNKSERVRKKMIGTNAIHTMQSWANRLKPYELRFIALTLITCSTDLSWSIS